ncbi:MAG: IS3 family transposase [Verrucomicrobia bacterium]|nr:IS3 family transposase [Verrucomicrobiota bacterium]
MEKKAGWQAARRAIQAQPQLTVLAVCRRVGMTPQNYYARRRGRQRRDVDLKLVLDLVRAQRREQPRLGGRKLYYLIGPELKKARVKLGRDRFFAELKKAGMLVERRPSEWPKTTRFDPALPVFKNLIKRRCVRRRNEVWVADITYIRTDEGFLYLELMLDLYSRKIVGFHLGATLEAKIVLQAFEMALKSLRPKEKPIHHSDRGCQYASHAFVERVKQAGLRLSMTERNHSAENSVAERLNGILKQEYWLDVGFTTHRQARQACTRAIALYNCRRPHTFLDLKTPEQVHQA